MTELQSLTWPSLLAVLEGDLVERERAEHNETHGDPYWREAGRRIHELAGLLLRARQDIGDDDIADIVQGLLLQLQELEALRRLRETRSPESYLAVSLRNAANDLAKRGERERRAMARLGLEEAVNAIEQDAESEAEGAARLREELRRLAPSDRMLVAMRFWKGMGIHEIARELDEPYSRVAVRMFRLVRRLRDRLATPGPGQALKS